MRFISCTLAAVVMVSLGPAKVAHAGGDYFTENQPNDAIKFRQTKRRTANERLLIGGFLATAGLFAGLGYYFQTDSQEASDAISTIGEHTGLVYDDGRRQTYERWERSRMLAIGSYSVGAGFIAATIAAVVVTFPGTELVKFDNDGTVTPVNRITASFSPSDGEFSIGRVWTY